MYVTLFGAANEVTGSCYLLRSETARILVDCGMFQGSQRLELQNRIPAQLGPKTVDAVLLTHGHLDHCGRLPLLTKGGFAGPIFATEGTAAIAKLILSDAAKIEEEDTARENRQRKKDHLPLIKPVFRLRDVEQVCRQFQIINYNHWFEVTLGVKAQFVEAGHILGSSSIMLDVSENETCKRLVFSGDLGRFDAPIMCDPLPPERADIVFLESTYGDRNHPPLAKTLEEFESQLKAAIARKGKILIPTFAVGRTQQILYQIAAMIRRGAIAALPIYLDSPMAIAATELYAKHIIFMDEEAQNLQLTGQLETDLTTLKTCQTAEESKALNNIEGPCIILAGAGMCNAGRILHHLLRNLNSPETLVVIVGYQAKGSIGRDLIEGATQVKILGETVRVRATVRGIGGFSAHADQKDLLRWLRPCTTTPPKVVLTHGESHAIDQLAYAIKKEFDISCLKPKQGETLQF